MRSAAADELIAVTGAGGAVGGRVAVLLAAAGARPLMIVRDRGREAQHAGAEVRTVSGYGAPWEMRRALAGARTLFLVPATEAPDRVEQHVCALDAAIGVGVERIVYLSFVGAATDATFTFARDHAATERHIVASGLRATLLRMNLFIDVIPSMVSRTGTIAGPAGGGRFAAVTRDDVAAAAAAVLMSEGHDGRTYDLTGPQALSLADAAQQLTAATGVTVSYEDQADDEAFRTRRVDGNPEWAVRGWVSSYQAIRDGSLAHISPDVRELTGSEPASLAAFMSANRGCLDHLSR